MLEYLKGVQGAVCVNNVNYESIDKAIQDLQKRKYNGPVEILLGARSAAPASSTHAAEAPVNAATSQAPVQAATDNGTIYKIKVRQYMTKAPNAQFEFHTKWNNGIPMPMRIMVGKKLQETRGMVKMELWAQITEEVTMVCMKCGRTLTNPVSRYFGIGPECGGHNYVHPFDTDEELRAAVAAHNAELQNIRWTGWIIKSSLESVEVIAG